MSVRGDLVVTDYRYRAYGQIIDSEFPLDILEPAAGEAATIFVRLRDGLRRQNLPQDPFFEISPDRQFFEWASVGAFEITAPNCIYVDPRPDVSFSLVRQPLLGIVISVVLERLGYFCLHGGSVDVDRAGVIVLGDKGAGKSTTVSSLLRAGHTLLTDDLVALDCDNADDPPMIQTGFPAIKLWPDSADALAVDTSQGAELIHPSITKIQKQIDLSAMAHTTPAQAIFILSPDKHGETRAEQLSETAALQALLYYAFIARFGTTALGKAHLKTFMQRCCHVVKTTPVFVLHIRPDLTQLDRLVATIEHYALPPPETG